MVRGDMLDLICLPYAGAGDRVFASWSGKVPAWVRPVPVCLPGRGARSRERLHHDWASLLDRLLMDLAPRLARPFALFGHSMGALVAVELAYLARERLGVEPLWLGVSGCVAPSRRVTELKWIDCAEDALIAEVRSLGGTPEALLDDRDFMDLFLPVLRADFHLCGAYRSQRRSPLRCPLFVAAGRDDPISQDAGNLSAWGEETSGPVRVEMFDGGHFFIEDRRDPFLRALSGALSDARVVQ